MELVSGFYPILMFVSIKRSTPDKSLPDKLPLGCEIIFTVAINIYGCIFDCMVGIIIIIYEGVGE